MQQARRVIRALQVQQARQAWQELLVLFLGRKVERATKVCKVKRATRGTLVQPVRLQVQQVQQV